MNEIIADVCRGNKIHPDDFFSQLRDPKLGRARRIAIHRLKQAGFTTQRIARIMRRNYSTIQYWLYPKYRLTKKRKHAARVAARRAAQ